MSGLSFAKLHPSVSPISNLSFGPRSNSTRAATESPTLTPTLSPKGHQKISLCLITIMCTGIPMLLFCLWCLGRRYNVKRRITTKSLFISKTTNSKVVTKERKQISGHSSHVSTIRYLNPITKESTVPSDTEYFLLDNNPSK